jgi:hypothetical protein
VDTELYGNELIDVVIFNDEGELVQITVSDNDIDSDDINFDASELSTYSEYFDGQISYAKEILNDLIKKKEDIIKLVNDINIISSIEKKEEEIKDAIQSMQYANKHLADRYKYFCDSSFSKWKEAEKVKENRAEFIVHCTAGGVFSGCDFYSHEYGEGRFGDDCSFVTNDGECTCYSAVKYAMDTYLNKIERKWKGE